MSTKTSHKQQILIGDTVTWTSQSQGSTKTKTGTVVAVVPPLEHPLPYAPDGEWVDTSGFPRSKESYLIKVEGRKGLYWPHASRLKIVATDLRITSGIWKLHESAGNDGRYEAEIRSGNRVIAVLEDDLEEHRGNGQLMAEAGTVSNETGLTPRQLAEQRAELLEALKSILNTEHGDGGYSEDEIAAFAKARVAIAKAEGKEGN